MKDNIKSILMIDDNEVDVYITTRYVEKSKLVEHFEAETDPIEAFSKFESYVKTGEGESEHFPPSVVMLDINMPGMTGFEFLEAVEKLVKECPTMNSVFIVMLSSSNQKEDIERAMKYPFVLNYFPKPLSLENLETIAKGLKGRELAGAKG